MTELERLERDTPAWTVDANGNHVRRAELIDAIVTDAVDESSVLDGLWEDVQGSSKKTWSKSKVLELIDEHRP